MTKPEEQAGAQAWLELPDGKFHWFDRACRIGRGREGNDLVIDERLVSTHHVNLIAGPDGYTLIDQHSTNGTYLNGMLAQKASELKDGDEIRLAKNIRLRFRCLRELRNDGPAPTDLATVRADQLDVRECWLLLADVAGYSGLIAELGSEGALKRLQTWIVDMQPLLEKNGGAINSYVGDAIFAYWPCDRRVPEEVVAAVRAVESHRASAAVRFRIVLHYGSALFTRSTRGEELTGQEINFLFRSEKIGKRLGCETMLSEAAVKSLRLAHVCEVAGQSGVDGIEGAFTFHRLPRNLATLTPR